MGSLVLVVGDRWEERGDEPSFVLEVHHRYLYEAAAAAEHRRITRFWQRRGSGVRPRGATWPVRRGWTPPPSRGGRGDSPDPLVEAPCGESTEDPVPLRPPSRRALARSQVLFRRSGGPAPHFRSRTPRGHQRRHVGPCGDGNGGRARIARLDRRRVGQRSRPRELFDSKRAGARASETIISFQVLQPNAL